ncbi:hypothetical protein N7468_006757 [Penicillium chermesinum]|uniref:Uncharacterized protein n=1 Tax=Penicillium chermesinum TaxID=63820 RepID=A0A9W9NSW0_9EURO|nr:uncharacterized protein N7468_006757 [Penicillium chermesinum]KAJ5225532.1 hypothetical protein N7468_006757 [Penicillium chermesinum]
MPSQKPELPPLKTPKSFTFPSEIHDDHKVVSAMSTGSAGEIKQEDSSESSCSSIPTPSAYTDFLTALTPVFSSPRSAGGTSFPIFKIEKTDDPSPISQPSASASPAFSSAPSLKSPSISLPPRSPSHLKSPKSPPCTSTTAHPAVHQDFLGERLSALRSDPIERNADERNTTQRNYTLFAIFAF